MSRGEKPNRLPSADLLMFDDVPVNSSNTSLATAQPRIVPQPQAADWFSSLPNNAPISQSSGLSVLNAQTPKVQTQTHNSATPAHAARTGNYNVPRDLFQLTPAVSAAVATHAPALDPSTSAGGLTTTNADDNDEFGDFIGTLTPTVASTAPNPPPQIETTATDTDIFGNRQLKSPALPSPSSGSSLKADAFSVTTHGPKQPTQRNPPVPHSQPVVPRSPLSTLKQKVNPRAAGYGGVNPPPLRFGQHLVQGSNGSKHLSPQLIDTVNVPQQPRKDHLGSTTVAQAVPPSNIKDTSDDFKQWPDFDAPAATEAKRSVAPNTPAVPQPHVLLALFQSNLFPLPLNLFQELTPLPFPLKRRVLSHVKTKRFFAALLAGAEVAIRICAGRKRRGGRFEADREAREVARLWRSLRERIAGVGMRDLPYVDASFTFRDYAGEKTDLCIVCGVARHEKVRGCVGETAWDFDNGGHTTCIKWWAHEKAVLDC